MNCATSLRAKELPRSPSHDATHILHAFTHVLERTRADAGRHQTPKSQRFFRGLADAREHLRMLAWRRERN